MNLTCETSKMNLTKLPEEFVINLLGLLPVDEFYDFNRVVPQWEELYLKSGARRTVLTILIGENPLQLVNCSRTTIPFEKDLVNPDGTRFIPTSQLAMPSKWSILKYQTLDENVVELVELFPNVAKLEMLICADNLEIKNLIYLLNSWQSQLKTLKIRMKIDKLDIKMRSLFELINSMSSLKHLTFEFNGSLFKNISPWNVVPLNLSILAQLEEFSFFSDDNINFLGHSLKFYATTNQNLRKIDIGNYVHSIKMFNSFNIDFCNLFTTLIFDDTILMVDLVRFTSLTVLELCQKQESIVMLTQYLAPLNQLIHLYLYCIQPAVLPVNKDDPGLVPLHSIKVVTLQMDFNDHHILNSFQFGVTFPALKALYLINERECYICNTCYSRRNSKKSRTNCIKHLCSTLSLCTDLQKMFFTRIVGNEFFEANFPIKLSLVEKVV